MNKIKNLSHKFKKDAQKKWQARQMNLNGPIEALETMKKRLLWFKNNPKMHHSLRQISDDLLSILNRRILPPLLKLNDIIDDEDYFKLDDNKKKQVAQLYNDLIHQMNYWYYLFRGDKWAEPWDKMNLYEYYSQKIIQYLKFSLGYMRRFPYLGKLR